MDLACALCNQVLRLPVSLPCGHSFCKACLVVSMQPSGSCPSCGNRVHLDVHTAPVSNVLQSIIQSEHPESTQTNTNLEINGPRYLPLFVLNCECLPGKAIDLHIFENRYRLMMERVLQGSQKFGMATTNPNNNTLRTVGVTLIVEESEPLPDGRSLIAAQCTERFRILEHWKIDDYLVGSVEYFQDKPLQEEQISETKELFKKIEIIHDQFIDQTYCLEVESLLHNRPSIKEETISVGNSSVVEEYSFWVFSFLKSEESLFNYMLSITDTFKRLQLLDTFLPLALSNPDEPLSLSVPAVSA